MITMHSTRSIDNNINIVQAITQGLAPDGGLYVPSQFPQHDIEHLKSINNYAEFAYQLLTPFFAGSVLANKLELMCQQAFNFELPCQRISQSLQTLELFHGPTLSFKDVGARFIAQCLNTLDEPRTVLVATSGDTGSAVAASCHGLDNIQCIVLFPDNKISLRQQQQITCWGDNIQAIAVEGRFDDCQDLVKNAFTEKRWQGAQLTTANSINIARLLPQMVYYAFASLHYDKAHNFIIPSGNLGNVTACYWAKKQGFPIEKILIATNANQVVSDYLQSGHFLAKDSINTLANAMDVGNPSNLERLNYLFNDFNQLQKNLNVKSIDDNTIEQAIIHCYHQHHYLLCPHTATAFARWKALQSNDDWVIVATAHPAKFETVIEPLLNIKIEIPNNLAKLLTTKHHHTTIKPTPDNLYHQTHIL